MAQGMLSGRDALRSRKPVPDSVVAEPLPFRRVKREPPEPDKIPNDMHSTQPSSSASTRAAIQTAARRAALLCLDNKARDVVMLDLKGVSDMTDFFIIASGTSDTHVRSTAQHVMDELRKEGVRVEHVEGLEQGRWVLLDYVDFVVHVFHPTLRQFYQLERLWGDAEVTQVDLTGTATGAAT